MTAPYRSSNNDPSFVSNLMKIFLFPVIAVPVAEFTNWFHLFNTSTPEWLSIDSWMISNIFQCVAWMIWIRVVANVYLGMKQQETAQ